MKRRVGIFCPFNFQQGGDCGGVEVGVWGEVGKDMGELMVIGDLTWDGEHIIRRIDDVL